MKTVAWSCLFDDERFVQRINKFRKQRYHFMNKRVMKITTKTKMIGKLSNSEKKSKKNNNKRGEDVEDKEEEVVGLPNIESIDKDEAEKDKQSVPAASTDAIHFSNLKGLTTHEIIRISDILDVKALVP